MSVISAIFLVFCFAAVIYAVCNTRLLLDYCDLIEGSLKKGDLPDKHLKQKAEAVLRRLYFLLLAIIVMVTISQALNSN